MFNIIIIVLLFYSNKIANTYTLLYFSNIIKDNIINENSINNYYIVTDVLDLHGLFPEQIPEIVDEFIKNAINLNIYQLRIIHGKGKSKLKWIVRKELEKNLFVDNFYDAPPESGGWGATIIELKK